MSQIHCYLPDDLAKKLEEKAKQAHLSVSKYLAQLIKHDLEGHQWPEGYFELFGAWQGEPLERETQERLEERERLD